jgi:hypothetical protein
MNAPDFAIYSDLPDPRFGRVESFPGISQDWRLSEGLPMGSDIGAQVRLQIHGDSGNVVGDFVNNIINTLLVSARARDLLAGLGMPADALQFHPVTLLHKNGRPVEGGDYTLANVTRRIACMDRDKSECRTRSDGTTVVVMKSLHLARDRIPADACLFRLQEFPRMTLFRYDLVERIRAAGFAPFRVRALGEDLRA